MMLPVLLLRVAATARALGQVLGPRAETSTIEATSQSVWTPGQIETMRTGVRSCGKMLGLQLPCSIGLSLAPERAPA
ncbi:hypothetical protein OH76DRAFT_471569 [Lentinus brumalis]|uniref:Secreted protein n=1 Tax=Lentinus brumalis TaxID=2498619 RepID=A0A371DCX9_9APHY|nr:hypothetical protein OH76DRAFT_471569 [Polyporus brumalis]